MRGAPKISESVVLKGVDSPKMSITDVDGSKVGVSWFDANKTLQTATFDEACLEKAKEDDEPASAPKKGKK